MEAEREGKRDKAPEISVADHMHQETIIALSWIVEACDPCTVGHEQRVASFVHDLARGIKTDRADKYLRASLAGDIAREMGLDESTVEGIYVSSLVLDIGKLQLPEEIPGRAAQPDDAWFIQLREHPKAGYDILKNIPLPWPIATIIHQHHERMDGSGYPQGLKGDEILLEARVVAVADVVESISGHRPHGPGLGIEFALEEVTRNRGTLYDGEVVDACLRLFRENGYTIMGTSPFF